MKAPRRAELPAGACWEAQRENQTVTALRGITSHSCAVCFGPSFLSGTQAPNEAQPAVWEAAVISSLHLLADVGAEGDVRPLRGAVPHCRARAGAPGQFVQVPSVQSGCFQPISSSHQQQLPTSGAPSARNPSRASRNWELGGSEPSLGGKGGARLNREQESANTS